MSVKRSFHLFSTNGAKRHAAVDMAVETAVETAVLRTVAYVDVFDYPPTAAQIHRYLEGVAASRADIDAVLANGRLIPHKLIRRDDYFMLPHRAALAAVRRQREAVSRRLWPKAQRYGRFMARLPFVRMVAVTGSLTMNNAQEEADIDYLVVTANGRLWLCRAFIVVLVRLARRAGVELCPNYILAENALEFTGRDLYTAHEVTQMVPLFGLDVYQRIRALNDWTAVFLPNAAGPPDVCRPYAPGKLQTLLERPLQTAVGTWLNDWEMNRKIRRLRAQETDNSETAFTADYCKGHFDAHNHHTLAAYRQRIESIFNNLSL